MIPISMVVSRQYGEQVRKIWIRSLAGNPLDLTRSLEAFRDVPKTTWRIFHEASELALNAGRILELLPVKIRLSPLRMLNNRLIMVVYNLNSLPPWAALN